ncbi:Hypothetical predicted protein [Paramuricea clavata]|uniref:Uncharacterized protein n=1 Tax=Paramuricea clavata TaxID=317549 RepID=A0A7D9ES60_PARCT|nr:Hypothetical predicted protein [Paramuricea clavata]
MRAKPIAVTINNYPSNSSNEVIELENHPTTVHYGKLGHAKVSPEPYQNNYVDDVDTKLKRRSQKCLNVFLTVSCILSLAALGLVCALLFGFIEPRDSRKLNGCLCRTVGLTGRTNSIALTKNGKYSDLNDEVKELKNNSKNVNETLVSMQAAFDHQAKDINKLTGQINSIQNFQTGEKLTNFSHEINERLTNIEKHKNKTEKHIFDVMGKTNSKIDEWEKEIRQNMTQKMLQRAADVDFTLKKFINETNKKMSETRNFTTSMLQRNAQQVEKMNSSIWEKLSTMRGPRGYNGSQGIAGPSGPQGAQGRQGLRGLTIEGCQNHTETQLVKFGKGTWDFAITLKSTVRK